MHIDQMSSFGGELEIAIQNIVPVKAAFLEAIVGAVANLESLLRVFSLECACVCALLRCFLLELLAHLYLCKLALAAYFASQLRMYNADSMCLKNRPNTVTSRASGIHFSFMVGHKVSRPQPISASTSSVCCPSVGAGRRLLGTESDHRPNGGICRTRPSVGWSTISK